MGTEELCVWLEYVPSAAASSVGPTPVTYISNRNYSWRNKIMVLLLPLINCRGASGRGALCARSHSPIWIGRRRSRLLCLRVRGGAPITCAGLSWGSSAGGNYGRWRRTLLAANEHQP